MDDEWRRNRFLSFDWSTATKEDSAQSLQKLTQSAARVRASSEVPRTLSKDAENPHGHDDRAVAGRPQILCSATTTTTTKRNQDG